MDKELIKKLKIKPGRTLLVVNSPAGYEKRLGAVDTKPAAKTYDFVQIFVKSRADLDKIVPKVIKSLKDDALFWISYPKKSSSIKTDISRDQGWDSIKKAGFEGVSLISLDETWSAMRFRAVEKIPSLKRGSAAGKKQAFTAVLESPGDLDGAFVTIPFNVEKTYGAKGHVKVKAFFDGYPYRGILANMGTGCHVIIVRKDIRKAIGKEVGDKVNVEIEPDTEDRVVEIPADVAKVLKGQPKAKQFFDSLSYTNRKEYAQWISSAKKTETREKRLEETVRKLLAGLKNPTQK